MLAKYYIHEFKYTNEKPFLPIFICKIKKNAKSIQNWEFIGF